MDLHKPLFTEKTFVLLAGLLAAGSLWMLRHGTKHPTFLFSAVSALALWYFRHDPFGGMLKTTHPNPSGDNPAGITIKLSPSVFRIIAISALTSLNYLFIYLGYALLPWVVISLGGREVLDRF